jgi:hypothetical protein
MRMVSVDGRAAEAPPYKLSAQQRDNLTRSRVPTQKRLLEHGRPIARHLKTPAAGRHELDPCLRKRRMELRRQTGSAWLVVSERAVLDRDVHV